MEDKAFIFTPDKTNPVTTKTSASVVKTPVSNPGWWSVAELKGTPDGAKKTINANADIPQHWKDALTKDIDSAVAVGGNFVRVNAHCFVDAKTGSRVIHAKVETSTIQL